MRLRASCSMSSVFEATIERYQDRFCCGTWGAPRSFSIGGKFDGSVFSGKLGTWELDIIVMKLVFYLLGL